jgi:Xaa-Pro aminopeptidase
MTSEPPPVEEAQGARDASIGSAPNGSVLEFEWPVVTGMPIRQYGVNAFDHGAHTVNTHRMRRYCIDRVREQLGKRGVSAILCLDGWNVGYITGTSVPYWSTGPAAGIRYALLHGDQEEAILYENGEIGYHSRASCPWLYKVKVAITGSGVIGRTMGPTYAGVQTRKLVQQVLHDLREAGFSDSDVLTIDAPDPVVVAEFERVGVALSWDGPEVMEEARKIKSRDEVECLQVSCAIGDAMFGALKENLSPGVRENELLGAMHKRCYELGGRIYSGVWLASGPPAWPNPRDENDRQIQPRDIVYSDVYNTSFFGYKICYYRTFSCGSASAQARSDYARALDWINRVVEMIRPGVTTRDLAERWPPGPEIWRNIHVHYEDQTAGSNWGHGIGLSLYEPPIIWREASISDPVPLEAGMTFAVETQHGTPGQHGVRIEEMVHVTEDGAEVLSRWPVDEITEVEL